MKHDLTTSVKYALFIEEKANNVSQLIQQQLRPGMDEVRNKQTSILDDDNPHGRMFVNTLYSKTTGAEGRPQASCLRQVEACLKDMGMASVWAMVRWRPI